MSSKACFSFGFIIAAVMQLVHGSGEITCPPDWVVHDANKCCYKFVDDSVASFYMARMACLMEGAHLVSIHNQEENDFVLKRMQNITRNQFWIGARADENRTWEWDDLTSFDYTNWSPGEPNDWGDDVEQSAKMEPSNESAVSFVGKWNDVPQIGYHNRKAGYVCKRCSESQYCPDKWLEFGQSCYLMLSSQSGDTRTQSNDAEEACAEYEAKLLTINNEYEQKYIAKIGEALAENNKTLQRQKRSPWFGDFRYPTRYTTQSGSDTDQYAYIRTGAVEVITDTRNTPVWVWQDDQDMDYRNWAPGFPTDLDQTHPTPKCLFLKREMNYQWVTGACNLKAEIICMKPKDYSNYNAMKQTLLEELQSRPHYVVPYPTDGSAVPVEIYALMLTSLNEIDSKKTNINVGLGFLVHWSNPSLAWNASYGRFKGLNNINMKSYHVWNPELNFIFTELKPYVFHAESVVVRSSGNCYYIARLSTNVRCRYSSFNFPFDSMECTFGIGAPPGFEKFYKIVTPQQFVFRHSYTLDYVLKGHIHQGWRVSELSFRKNKVIDKDPSQHHYLSMSEKSGTLNPTEGYLMVDVSLDRIYSYYTLSMVIPLLCSMVLILVSFWISDQSTASLILLASLLIGAIFLQEYVISMPHSIDAVPFYIIMYGLTIVFIGVSFIVLMALENNEHLTKCLEHEDTIAKITSPLYSISQKMPGSHTDLFEKEFGTRNPAKETTHRKPYTFVHVIKKILCLILFLIESGLFIAFLTMIYLGVQRSREVQVDQKVADGALLIIDIK